jgi:hypothetical protein
MAPYPHIYVPSLPLGQLVSPSCPNISFCQTPITSPESDTTPAIWTTTHTVDIVASLPTLLQAYKQPTLPKCKSEPHTPSYVSPHPYHPKVRARSHSPPSTKKTSPTRSYSPQNTPQNRSPRKNDNSGDFLRQFHVIIASDEATGNEWKQFVDEHGCPKSRTCIRTYLSFCEERVIHYGEADPLVQLRRNSQWDRLGTRTACHCKSFSPIFTVRSLLSPYFSATIFFASLAFGVTTYFNLGEEKIYVKRCCTYK